MKKWFVIAGVIVVVGLGLWVWSSLSDSSTALMFSGAMKSKVAVDEYAIPASGTNLRGYSWTDPSSGMKCVAVYSSKSGGGHDCEFPPTP